MSILVVVEHNNADLNMATANAVAAATKLGDDVHALVAGHDCSTVAEQAAKLSGVTKVISVDDASLAHQLAEAVAPQVIKLADAYSHILVAATTTGKNLLPRVAAALDVQPLSDVIEVIDAETFKRPIYAGNVIATVKSNDSKKLLTIRTTAFDAVTLDGSASVETVAAEGAAGASEFVGEELAKSDRPELAGASIVISGGRGMQNGDNFELLYSVADKLGAAVGASRAAVDAGFVPNDMQVGQTGKIVAPDLYIAVGISGAIQHLAGMKDSKVIVAINKDEEAPIFSVADYGLVADLFTAVPELDESL